jgi:alkane 1-monooxygenase
MGTDVEENNILMNTQVNKDVFKTKLRTYQWLYSLEPPLMAAISLALYLWLGFSTLLWLTPFFIFAVLPIMDYRSPSDLLSPELVEDEIKMTRSFCQWVVRSYVPIQYTVNILGVACIATMTMSIAELVGLVLTVGIINGLAIAPAHELNHQSSKLNTLFSILAISPAVYGQFLIEHNRGHHVKVATPEDPASARMGESFWEFAPRSIVLGLLSACKLELTRMQRSFSLIKIVESRLLQSWTCSALIFIAGYFVGGMNVLWFLAAQAAVGILLLEVVNYVEHYGLLRAKVGGRYEPCTPQHSWNSNKLVSNIGLFNLQRHSDHHANALRPFETLRHFEESPQHPSGYAGMIVLALIPALWFKVMNNKVVAHYNGDVRKANLHPRKASKLIAQYDQS